MSVPVSEFNQTAEEQQQTGGVLSPPAEIIQDAVKESDSGEDAMEQKDNGMEKLDELGKPMGEIDTEGEDVSPCDTVVPSNTPVTGDSGHVSPTMEISSDSLSDSSTQQQQDPDENCIGSDSAVPFAVEAVTSSTLEAVSQPIANGASNFSEGDASSQSGEVLKAKKNDKKEEKKKSKKKEDKSVEYILRALNSLQSPEEKLAALCKKFADMHEEHRVLQTSFKTRQQTLTMVIKEKEQLQSEHTKAMMAKGKLESLCRELQKHNKVIENESIKRAKESDEKRKEISAHFSATISEIQNQMTDNSEKNNMLRKENENLADQLRSFISQCQARDEHVKKLQEQHDLENQLAAAKLTQAETIIREVEERSKKEKELMLLKLTEMTKKSQLTEAQLELYKSKYDEFNDLHARSNDTFQKYKTEMDKMTKRIKKLEKDGMQWKAKWEASNKTLLEQYEAKSKSEQEAAVYGQKVKKLESLCRALQAELHKKKSNTSDPREEGSVQPESPKRDDRRSASTVPPNSPEVSSSSESSPAPGGAPSSETVASCLDCQPAGTSPPQLCSNPVTALSQVLESSVTLGDSELTKQDLERGHPFVSSSGGADTVSSSGTESSRNLDVTQLPQLTPENKSESKKPEASACTSVAIEATVGNLVVNESTACNSVVNEVIAGSLVVNEATACNSVANEATAGSSEANEVTACSSVMTSQDDS